METSHFFSNSCLTSFFDSSVFVLLDVIVLCLFVVGSLLVLLFVSEFCLVCVCF